MEQTQQKGFLPIIRRTKRTIACTLPGMKTDMHISVELCSYLFYTIDNLVAKQLYDFIFFSVVGKLLMTFDI